MKAKLKRNKDKTINIALLLYDHMLATSVSLPVEMLRAGEAVALQENRQAPRLSIQMVAESIKPISTRALIKLLPDTDIEHAQHPDFAFIPSLWRNPRPTIAKQPKMLKWLSDTWQQGTTLIGGGTGDNRCNNGHSGKSSMLSRFLLALAVAITRRKKVVKVLYQ